MVYNPTVSVVIPSYNHSLFIGKAIESVVSQSLERLELIVVDDGSRDNSLEIIEGFNDPRLKLMTQPNRGAHAAINRGIAAARGKYIAILNSDDFFHSERLERCLNTIEKTGSSFVTSYITLVDSANTDLGVKEGFYNLDPWPISPSGSLKETKDPLLNLLATNYTATTSNFFFKTDLVQEVGQFAPLRYCHDWDFALRVASKKPIAFISEPLLSYRTHDNNTIRENRPAMVLEILWVLARNLPHMGAEVLKRNSSPAEFARFLSRYSQSSFLYGCGDVLSTLMMMATWEDSCSVSLLEQILEEGSAIREELILQVSQRCEISKA